MEEHKFTLRKLNEVLWIITVSADDDFVNGFLYGSLFHIRRVEDHYIIHESRGHLIRSYRTFNDILQGRDFITRSYIPLHDITMQQYAEDARTKQGQFGVWLLHPRDPQIAGLAFARSASFFQGLFSALKAANISYIYVILHKPIKDGVDYEIEGVTMTLPTLQKFIEE